MIVYVGHEEHRDGALLLRRERLSPRSRPLRRDHAVERAVRIALARLVIKGEHDVALHVAPVIVVPERRRANAEAGERDGSAHASSRAETMRIELLADGQLPRETRAIDHVERVE